MIWITRFINNIRQKPKHHYTTPHYIAQKIQVTYVNYIRISQWQSYPEEYNIFNEGKDMLKSSKTTRYSLFLQDGLIRLGDRFQFADPVVQQKHPILLSGTHNFTKLVILKTHLQLHNIGVRTLLFTLQEEFQIVKTRRASKKVIY